VPLKEKQMKPLVSIIMGSTSDMPVMKQAAEVLDQFEIPFEINALSAHRVPEQVEAYATSAYDRGIRVVIAGAGGAAHLPGMIASHTVIPVIGVPIKSRVLSGVDSLLSIVQMPAGVPVATMSIGTAGAKNAALYCAAILACHDKKIKKSLDIFRQYQTQAVLDNPDPSTEQ